jgi:hypothetical protein
VPPSLHGLCMFINRTVSPHPQLEADRSAHSTRTCLSSSTKDAGSSSSFPTHTGTSTIEPKHISADPVHVQLPGLGVGSSTTRLRKQPLTDDHYQPEIDSEERRKQRKRESSKKLYYENREENAKKALERNKRCVSTWSLLKRS